MFPDGKPTGRPPLMSVFPYPRRLARLRHNRHQLRCRGGFASCSRRSWSAISCSSCRCSPSTFSPKLGTGRPVGLPQLMLDSSHPTLAPDFPPAPPGWLRLVLEPLVLGDLLQVLLMLVLNLRRVVES